MSSLLPFVERRTETRLRDTPLRRRTHVRPAAVAQERRSRKSVGFDAAGLLELNLDRYPTKQSMLTYLQTLMYAGDQANLTASELLYMGALQQATEVVREAPTLVEAAATFQGYQAFMAAREARQIDGLTAHTHRHH